MYGMLSGGNFKKSSV